MTNYTTSTPLISDPDLAYGILVVGVDNTGRLLDPLSLLSELDPVFGASPAAGITTQKITNWDTAYGWGNHATAGYETTTQLNARDTANRNRANHTGTQLAATISDIGTTISANTDVAANTAARHAAVTVTDSSEIDFTLTGQNITASLINGSIGETRLSSGVNTSLGLANTALQPSTIGVTVQGYSAILAGITTQKITNWDTAYGWGNHATAGYLTTFTESDPVFGASPAAGITTQKITNWDTAYGWGNHATAGYETTTQLNARDTANRNRANHTGTQLAATISDIGTTISANTDVAANTAARHASVTVTDSSEIDFTLTGQNITASLINGSIGETRLSSGVNTSLGLANTALQPSTIGVTVQGYSAILAGTTASFTTADKSKIDGIQAGAQVNNISDVNATDLTDGGETTLHIHDGRYYTESETNALINNAFANPTFTGLLTTPTLRLNGTAVIVNNSAPTVRSDGSALVAGDLWWNPSTGIWGFWKSPYWLGPSRYLSIPVVFGNSSNQTIRAESAGVVSALYVSSIVHQIAVLNAANTATDYWTAAISVSGTPVTTLSTQNAVSYPHNYSTPNTVIPARASIPVGGTLTATALDQTSRNWIGMTTLGTDVYACVLDGDIYKQTNGTGSFVALGQTTRRWRGMTTLGTDVYACVISGDIYKQTNGTGNFLPLGQTSRQWAGMTTLGTDVYACVQNGDIYKQTNGTGNFLPLGQTLRGWLGMTTLGTDVYACVQNGDIYKQTNGTGNFLPLGQTSRGWHGMTTLGTDVYACVLGGDIYKQTNGTGDFLPLGQTSRNWHGMTALGTDIYACVYGGGDIYLLIPGSVTSIGHSLEVALTRFGAVSLPYAAITVNFHEVLS